ncbi:hypothetical protein WICMUC_005272 [Wickerhamomyces mucosus]|uniref:Pre-mRNA-processing factor 39 n=1 Tax=Wickerhamomyces mucosus TaxID=1378264 RepID=A0A9P8P9K7_9ASCO|nr:hypothetical protein WICMUC_005272 [Wickerhamomyces mucosus]
MSPYREPGEIKLEDTKLPSEFNGYAAVSAKEDQITLNPIFLNENPEWKDAREKVTSSPNDIACWDSLITITESLLNKYPTISEVVKSVIQKTFDELLTRFPLFFGYWKKYISIQYQLNGIEESINTLSKSLDAFPHSLDLWLDYMTILISNYNYDKEKIRSNFEIGLKFIGNQFLSHTFWDKYLEFEKNEKSSENLMKILLKVIKIPLHQYSRYYQEFLELRPSVTNEFLAEYENELIIPETLAADSISTHIHEYFNNIFLETQRYVAEIWEFESQIKQSYFNLAPVAQEDVENWDKYLDYHINKYSATPTILIKAQTISTFERALIPNALNPKFWSKYINWYNKNFSTEFDVINSIYKKAVNFYIPINFIDIRLNYGLFLEAHKQNPDTIHEIYLAVISYRQLDFKPIISYIKFLARLKGYKETSAFLDKITSQYLLPNVKQVSFDLHGKKLLKLLNEKLIGILITENIKINWYFIRNQMVAKKLLIQHSKHEVLDTSVPFWSLTYKYYKQSRDFKSLSKAIRFIQYHSKLPITIINSISQDYSDFLKANVPDQDFLFTQNNYSNILDIEWNLANPLESRIESEAQLIKKRRRELGHPGVLNDKPEITNSEVDKLVDFKIVKLMPTFKNVEKANLTVEYIQNE